MKKRKISIGISICMILAFISQIIYPANSNTTMAATTQTATVNASTLNIRVDAGTNYAILKSGGKNVSLAKGTKVTIINTKTKNKEKWYYISFTFNKKTLKGYAYSPYLTIDKKITSSSTTNKTNQTVASLKIPAKVSNVTSLNVRTAAGTDKAQLAINNVNIRLTSGTKVKILKEVMVGNAKWYHISFTNNNKTVKGYVLSDYINLTLTKTVKAVVNTSSKIEIRTTAKENTSYLKDGGKVVSLKSGKKINIIKEVTQDAKKWYQVTFSYNGNTLSGYITANNVTFTSTASATIAAEQEPTTSVEPTKEPTTKATTTKETTKETTTKETTTQTTTISTTDSEVISTEKTAVGIVKGVSILGLSESPNDSSSIVELNGTKIYAEFGQTVDILKVELIDTATWYKISFVYQGKKVTGYLPAIYVEVEVENTQPTTQPITVEITEPLTQISDEEFEQKLKNEGFPESYKTYLKELHRKYPYWEFKAMHTGLNWQTVIENESKVGVNLITNTKNIAWKSMAAGAYSWESDKFIPYDGSTWVTASKAAVEYYMDPRNFLTEKAIFQFESLAYQSGYQNKTGLEAILKNTPMYKASYSWEGENGKVSMLYSETFMKAAEYSGVSPYHLATRVKQEVVSSSTVMSSSVSGTVSGYEGLYNFYNIGATHSTASGGAVINALNYAKNGTTNSITNDLYLIPWNNPYKSIVGGSQFIASSYIKRGQSTVYLQKFNVTSTSTYTHQYMANVEAANSEAIKTYAAYSDLEATPIVFSIPIYYNMPSQQAGIPVSADNPNNWLKTLEVAGYSLTPTFDLKKDQIYSLIVDNTVNEITINATAVSQTATVSGLGIYPLVTGYNEVFVNVTAQNGALRTYIIQIIKE